MHIGISLPTPADPSAIVAEAEERGFHSAWLYDSQMLYADLFIGMALAAKATKRIRIGSGVLVPSNRIAPVTATCLATLNKLAPGRIDLGIGTGFTARRTMGQGAVPLKDMFEQIRVVQALLRNERVDWQAEGATHTIGYLNPEIGMINLEDPVRVHVSAMGPIGRKRTAAIDAGWLTVFTGMGHVERELADMDAAWAAAGKDPAAQYSTCFGWGCVLDPGEDADSPRAKAQAGSWVAAALHNYMEAEDYSTGMGKRVSHTPGGAWGEAIEKYKRLYATYTPSDAKYLTLHRGHVMFLRPDEEPIVTADLMRRYTLTGTEEELVEKVCRIAAMGYSQFTIQITPGTEEDATPRWARIAEKVAR